MSSIHQIKPAGISGVVKGAPSTSGVLAVVGADEESGVRAGPVSSVAVVVAYFLKILFDQKINFQKMALFLSVLFYQYQHKPFSVFYQ